MRLDRFLVKSGYGPRKSARKLILGGEVQVNGSIVKIPSYPINPDEDRVTVDGRPVVYFEHLYIALYKPAGYVTSTKDSDNPTVLDLVSDMPFSRRVFPAGRLDKDAEGLVILTSDGEFAHRLTHPKYHIPQTYIVTLSVPLDSDKLDLIKRGEVTLADGYNPLPAEVEVIDALKVRIVVFEGKYHLVKRIFAAVGSKVVHLKRVAIGRLGLGDLQPGEYRLLTPDEVDLLRKHGDASTTTN